MNTPPLQGDVNIKIPHEDSDYSLLSDHHTEIVDRGVEV